MVRSLVVRWAGQRVGGHSSLGWQMEGPRGDAARIHDMRRRLNQGRVIQKWTTVVRRLWWQCSAGEAERTGMRR